MAKGGSKTVCASTRILGWRHNPLLHVPPLDGGPCRFPEILCSMWSSRVPETTVDRKHRLLPPLLGWHEDSPLLRSRSEPMFDEARTGDVLRPRSGGSVRSTSFSTQEKQDRTSNSFQKQVVLQRHVSFLEA